MIGKILVVDDEYPIREELKRFPWADYGFTLTGAARNGAEALALCRRECPDVLITDITMPVMGGMELIKTLRQEFPHMKFIILTCHPDFSYARQAIQYGVVAYLLKSDLSKENICEALQKAAEVVKKDRKEEEVQVNETRRHLAGLFKSPVVNGDLIRRELKELGFPMLIKGDVVFIIAENHLESWAFSEMAVRMYFRDSTHIKNWLIADNGCYPVILDREDEETIKIVLAGLKAVLEEQFAFVGNKIRFFAIQANAGNRGMELIEAVKNAGRWKHMGFYYPEIDVIGSSLLFELREPEEEDIKSCLEQLRNGAPAADFIRWVVGSHIYPLSLKKLVVHQMEHHKLDQMQGHETRRNQILEAGNIRELENAYTEYQKIQVNRYGRYEIRKVLEIIHGEYEKDINLAYVAEKVGLSPQYLSRLFSEAVGENLVNYLLKVRIEHARELILHSNLKVYQIAEAVGIPNYRYFTSMFKRYTGQKPQELKKGKTDHGKEDAAVPKKDI